MQKEVQYKKVDRLTWETIKDELPEEFIPTKKIGYIIGGILIIIIAINLFTFPWAKMMSPQSFDQDLTIKLGWPMSFFVMNLSEPETIPVRFFGLIIDFLIYLIIAYLLDVAMNYLIQTNMIQRMAGHGDFVDAKPKVITPKRI